MKSFKDLLLGSYYVNGVWLQNEQTRLLIKDRKHSLDKKAPKYLMKVENDKYSYISSLFKTGDQEYVFDNREQKFKLTFSEDNKTAYITEEN